MVEQLGSFTAKFLKPQRSRFLLAGLLLVLTSLIGCGTSEHVIQTAPPSEEYIAPEYRIGVGDLLSVNVWKNEDVSGDALVRPDGRISIALIGDVLAVGLTTTELTSNIAEKLGSYIRSPQVSVEVTQPASADYQMLVRITGAVANPTAVPFRFGMTVMDLVMAAGGTSEFGRGNKSLLYRKTQDDAVDVYRLKIDDIFQKGDLSTNYELRPADVIVVPERLF